MAFDLTNIKLVIFDLDGTLVESNEQEIDYFFKALRLEVGTDIDTDISQYPDRTFSSVINSMNSTISYQDLYEKLELKMTDFVQRVTWLSLPLGKKLLQQTIEQELDYFVVTGNFKQASIDKAALANIELPEERVYCTTLEFASKGKVIQTLISKHNYSPYEVLSIGDSQYDKDIADQLGLNFLWATA